MVIYLGFFIYILPKNISAITLWPFIILKHKKDKQNEKLLNHESIHIRQQIELLVLPFYLIYLLEYFILLMYYKNHDTAYRSISFEKEAYHYDHNLAYLKTRKLWGMWRNIV